MKKIALFLIGVIVGVAACFVVLYLSGSVLESFGVQFYQSEADQQRNFNIFLVVTAIAALVSGYYFARKLT